MRAKALMAVVFVVISTACGFDGGSSADDFGRAIDAEIARRDWPSEAPDGRRVGEWFRQGDASRSDPESAADFANACLWYGEYLSAVESDDSARRAVALEEITQDVPTLPSFSDAAGVGEAMEEYAARAEAGDLSAIEGYREVNECASLEEQR